MIFKQHQQVLDGLKSQTRRIVRTGEHLLHLSNGDEVVYAGGRTKWKVGRIYAIQPGRGQKSLGSFKLLSLRGERVQEISTKDVEAEAVRVVDAMPLVPGRALMSRIEELALMVAQRLFAELWDSINIRKGDRWADDPKVWVLGWSPESVEKYNVL